MRIRSTALSLTLVLTSAGLLAQPGAIDPTFNSTDTGFDNGVGVVGDVYCLAVQPDGKVLIGGAFTYINGSYCNRIARLNANGTLDAGFDGGTEANGAVRSIAVQPDGKILIGGDFTSYNSTARNRIARLNADGSLDTGFDPGSGASMSVFFLVLQPDGKILIAGDLTGYNGTARNHIARLNADGSLDTGFDPGSGANARIRTLALRPDGKIMIGGFFSSYNGTARNRLARLSSDGSLDPSFNPGSGTANYVYAIGLQSDGRILIGGNFYSYNDTARSRIARLNSDGTLDIGFNIGTGANDEVNSIGIQPDGRILIAGDFTSYNSIARNRIARLHADGSLDTGFNPGAGANDVLGVLALQPDSKVLLGGSFSDYNGAPRKGFTRLNNDASLDIGFNPGTGANALVNAIALQPDGKILIGGAFTSYNGTIHHRIARLNSDGSLDPSFNPGTGLNSSVLVMVVQPDGKILIGGDFELYNGAPRGRIARLNADGSLDTGFNSSSGANGSVNSMALQPDGKILIGGTFGGYAGTGRSGIARLNADGSLDTGFNPGTGAGASVYSIALQPDGKILVGGSFGSYNGTARNRIARVNADGSLDTGFDPGSGANAAVNSMALQPDGKILIGGAFFAYNGTGRNRIARLNADGSLDTSFDPGSGASNHVYAIAVLPDAKILIGGPFLSYNGTVRNCIARLNSGGTLDNGFDQGQGANNVVFSVVLGPDGKILFGGSFTGYNGTGRNRIARLEGDPSIAVHVKVHLEGAYSAATGLMSDALRVAGLVPPVEPYTALGYSFTGGGGENTIAPVLAVSGNNAIVDWAVVELRSDALPTTVLASKSALLQRDGDVVGMDGISPVRFTQPAGTYRIAIRHRNHLGAMTLNGVALSSAPTTVDLSTGGTATYGTAARKSVTGTFPAQVLWAGDVTFNGQIKYAGGGNDRDPILVRIGGLIPTATTNGYWGEDVNMNGLVKYAGSNNDRDPILSNIGGSTPTSVRNAQLP